MTRLDATAGQGADEDAHRRHRLDRTHPQLDGFLVLADEGMKRGPMALESTHAPCAPRAERSISVMRLRASSTRPRPWPMASDNAVGQTFPSVVVGLAPDEGGQELGRLVKTMLAKKRPSELELGQKRVLLLSESTASLSARGWSDKRLAT